MVTVTPGSWASRLLCGSPSMGPPCWLELRAGWGPGGSSCRAVGLWAPSWRMETWLALASLDLCDSPEYSLGRGLLHLGKQTLFILGSAEEPPDDGRMTPGPGPSRLSEGGRGGEEHGWDLGRGACRAGNHFFLSLRLVGELTSFVASRPSVPQTVWPLCVQEPFSAFPEQRALCPGPALASLRRPEGPQCSGRRPEWGQWPGPCARHPLSCRPIPPPRLQGLAGVTRSVCFCMEVQGGPLQEPRGPGRRIPL